MFDSDAHKRIDDVEKKLGDHLEHITRLEVAIVKNTSSLGENTLLTKEIAANTAELVELFKGAKTFRSFVLWISPFIIILYALHLKDDIQHVAGFVYAGSSLGAVSYTHLTLPTKRIV